MQDSPVCGGVGPGHKPALSSDRLQKPAELSGPGLSGGGSRTTPSSRRVPQQPGIMACFSPNQRGASPGPCGAFLLFRLQRMEPPESSRLGCWLGSQLHPTHNCQSLHLPTFLPLSEQLEKPSEEGSRHLPSGHGVFYFLFTILDFSSSGNEFCPSRAVPAENKSALSLCDASDGDTSHQQQDFQTSDAARRALTGLTDHGAAAGELGAGTGGCAQPRPWVVPVRGQC